MGIKFRFFFYFFLTCLSVWAAQVGRALTLGGCKRRLALRERDQRARARPMCAGATNARARDRRALDSTPPRQWAAVPEYAGILVPYSPFASVPPCVRASQQHVTSAEASCGMTTGRNAERGQVVPGTAAERPGTKVEGKRPVTFAHTGAEARITPKEPQAGAASQRKQSLRTQPRDMPLS